MVSGQIEFACKASDLNIQQFHYAPTKPGTAITKVEVTCDDKIGLAIVVHLVNAADNRTAEAMALEEVSSLIDRLAYSLALVKGSVFRFGLPAVASLAIGNTVANTLSLVTRGCYTLNGQEVANLRLEITSQNPPGEDFFPAFHAALNSEDPATKFMGLYHLLMVLGHDDQKLVDKFIRKTEGSSNFAQTRPRRNDPTVFDWESKYTRLRNEFAHNRKAHGASIEKTRAEMEASLPGLVAVAKEAVRSMRPKAPKQRKKRTFLQSVRKWLGM